MINAKFRPTTFYFRLLMWYPVIYLFISMFLPSVVVDFARITFLITGCYFLYKCKNNKYSLIIIFEVLVITIFAILSSGIYYLINLDFWGFPFLLLVLFLFSKPEVWKHMDRDVRMHTKQLGIMLSIFFVLLSFSALFMGGVSANSSWGISMPILNGPYSVSHNLSYQFIFMYCIASVCYKETNLKRFFVFMILSVLLSIFTGARSGVLCILILVFTDFVCIRQRSKRTLIFLSALLFITGVLLFYPQLLINNPIVEKSIKSYASGSVSNGRELFSSYLLNYYNNSTSILQKISGVGVWKIRELMALKWMSEIHAHNDVLNILIGYGVVGFIVFLNTVILFIKQSRKKLLLFLAVFVLVYYNGLYMYVSFSPCIWGLLLFFNSQKVRDKYDNN